MPAAARLVLLGAADVLGDEVGVAHRRRFHARAEGPSSEALRKLSGRGALVGMILAADVIAIVFLMVTKPTL